MGDEIVKKNKYEIDMCNGSIMDKLISFSLPLMLSGILQLMFNAVDIVVVGRFSGWRRNYKVKGHPDFVFLNKKIAIFVDGCFWHGHDCRNTKPKDNQEYWDKKRERNMKHDKEITEYFENRGWTVIRIWECELKNKKALEKLKCIY